ncbi:class I SAM-dependent methyltransferase [Croceimicrobium hydrocarbonivorans]|uniref:Class I SAM-dependent methyltransferase n=1 Tax=Croceimicrobium hydrocarbonivorans TaxID=2761580 RepID=A0A7H0VF93_9FLAO|nr:class I SAM-dependent methyltransferase [Croceimicrobium hydrocarbonivorans]QNR24391.1 class I SAM-dependent methyltransferase [Croceimicrobium hydrocarbonivorans]
MELKVDVQNHWEKIYSEKDSTMLSWYQAVPESSMNWINQVALHPEAKILDVGGGDSRLVDSLTSKGFKKITVLDLSAKALEKARKRLGHNALSVKWLAQNILDYNPSENVDFWHDRAAFHFLRETGEIQQYKDLAAAAIRPGGYLLVATFSDQGPLRCSGLGVSRYNESELETLFADNFEMIGHQREVHNTPFDSHQEFLFMLLRRKKEE